MPVLLKIIFTVLCASFMAANAFAQSTNNDLSAIYMQKIDTPTRIAIQRALIWNSEFVGIADGNFTSRTINSLRAFQRSISRNETGVLSREELKMLFNNAELAEKTMGYKQYNDYSTGIAIGIPYKFLEQKIDYKRGTRFVSDDKTLDIVTMVIPLRERSLGEFYQQHVTKIGRQVDYKVFRGDWFVVNGLENGKHFYVRAHQYNDEIRGYAVSYDAFRAPVLGRLMTIMSSDFRPDLRSQTIAQAQADWSSAARGYSRLIPDELPKDTNTYQPKPTEIPNTSQQVTQNQPIPPAKAETTRTDTSYGTAFFVSKDGHLITNAHVVDGCKEINVNVSGKALLVDRDQTNDLALLKLQTQTDVIPLSIAKEFPRLGDEVIALGYPLQSILQNGLNMTRGDISSLAGIGGDSRFIQITAAVQPGNSGGPILNREGRVIGVVTSKLNAIRVANSTGDIPQSINFAIRPEILEVYLRRHSVQFTSLEKTSERLEIADLVDKNKAAIVPITCVK